MALYGSHFDGGLSLTQMALAGNPSDDGLCLTRMALAGDSFVHRWTIGTRREGVSLREKERLIQVDRLRD